MEIHCDGSGWNGERSRICLVTCPNGIEDVKITDLPIEFTNNEAEYLAMIWALQVATDRDIIYSDSQLVINQINGSYKIKQQHLKYFAARCQMILLKKKIKIIWIPREKNKAGLVFDKGG